jgi:hypothetical protein
VESTLTSQVINPAASARACRPAKIFFQVPSRCHRRNSPYTVCHGPYVGGTSRHGVPARIRHRIPSMSCRLLHFGGRPGFLPLGSNGSNTAHWTSVRSARPVTATLATRSPKQWSFLVEKPPIGDLTHLHQRHAAIPAGQAFETRSSGPTSGMASVSTVPRVVHTSSRTFLARRIARTDTETASVSSV